MVITVEVAATSPAQGRLVLDNEPDERPELAPSVFVFMAEEASRAATMAVHIRAASGCRPKPPRPPTWCVPVAGAGRRRPRGQPPRRIATSSPTANQPAKQPGDNGMDFPASNCPTRTRPFLHRGARLPRGPRSPRTSSATTARPGTTSTRACTWPSGPRASKEGVEADRRRRVHPVRRRIWELEKRRAHVPLGDVGTTAMVARSVASFGSPELKEKCCPGCSPVTSACAWATPNPRVARTSPPVRPAPCGWINVDHQRLQDVHHRRA